jgi:hypothetical protein
MPSIMPGIDASVPDIRSGRRNVSHVVPDTGSSVPDIDESGARHPFG